MNMNRIEKKISLRKILGSIKNNLFFMRIFKVNVTKNDCLVFQSSNYVTKFRYETFFYKEPETLSWIDAMEAGSNFWDIGANIGLYSIYFLVVNKGGRVTSFEPHPSNLVGLIDNLQKNNLLGDRVTIVPNPIYSSSVVCNFTINSSAIGDSNHSVSSGASNSYIKTNTATIEQLLMSGLAAPNYLKIDVDGNELDIINTADFVLKSKNLKSILIELDLNNSDESNSIIEKLSSYGFTESSRFDTMERFSKVSTKKLFNVVFSRC